MNCNRYSSSHPANVAMSGGAAEVVPKAQREDEVSHAFTKPPRRPLDRMVMRHCQWASSISLNDVPSVNFCK